MRYFEILFFFNGFIDFFSCAHFWFSGYFCSSWNMAWDTLAVIFLKKNNFEEWFWFCLLSYTATYFELFDTTYDYEADRWSRSNVWLDIFFGNFRIFIGFSVVVDRSILRSSSSTLFAWNRLELTFILYSIFFTTNLMLQIYNLKSKVN